MKSLMKPQGTRSISNLRNEMDRIFNDLMPYRWSLEDSEMETGIWAPVADLSETDDSYLIETELPGLNKKDINITYQDKMLTIEGERKKEKEEETNGYLRSERYFGTFKRSFVLPAAIREDKIKANFKEGVLKVTIPKAEKSKRKTVTIE